MAQQSLLGLPTLPVALKDIKKEPPFETQLHCNCGISVVVYTDSEKNCSPFRCDRCLGTGTMKEDEERFDLSDIATFAIVLSQSGFQTVTVILPGSVISTNNV